MATAQSYVIWDGVRRFGKGVAMTIETAERDPISRSDRTKPLTPVEMQASLHAMQRLLILLRMMAWGKADTLKSLHSSITCIPCRKCC